MAKFPGWTLILWWTLINFDNKFQGGRLFQRGRLLDREEYIIKKHEDNISFFPKGKYLLVHASEMNPCEYTLATLHGCGLRDQDLTRAFGKMMRRKVASFDDDMQWPVTPKKLLEVMDKGPIPELFNAIYYTMHDSGKVNEFGYAERQSHNAAIKIWPLASDWASLVTRRPNTTTMGLLIHRLTRSKEVIDILHKSSTSYTSHRHPHHRHPTQVIDILHKSSTSYTSHRHPTQVIDILHKSSTSYTSHRHPTQVIDILHKSSTSYTSHRHPTQVIDILHKSSTSYTSHRHPTQVIDILHKSSTSYTSHRHPTQVIDILHKSPTSYTSHRHPTQV